MAKADPKTREVGAIANTTIIFAKKGTVVELAKARRDAKKRNQSTNGTLGKKIGEAVEQDHLDRTAFSIACKLEAMDDERLHITYHNLLKYMEDLEVVKRATAQEDLFDPTAAAEEAGEEDGSEGGAKRKARGAGAAAAEGRTTPEGAGDGKLN